MSKGTLHHVEVNVSDLNEAKNFYKWFLNELGYELYQEWKQGFSMKLNETYIVFVQTEDRFLENEYHRKQVGLNHLAFSVENKKAVDEWTIRLKSKGYNILYEDRHPYAGGQKHYAVYFEAPDRIKIELVASE